MNRPPDRIDLGPFLSLIDKLPHNKPSETLRARLSSLFPGFWKQIPSRRYLTDRALFSFCQVQLLDDQEAF